MADQTSGGNPTPGPIVPKTEEDFQAWLRDSEEEGVQAGGFCFGPGATAGTPQRESPKRGRPYSLCPKAPEISETCQACGQKEAEACILRVFDQAGLQDPRLIKKEFWVCGECF